MSSEIIIRSNRKFRIRNIKGIKNKVDLVRRRRSKEVGERKIRNTPYFLTMLRYFIPLLCFISFYWNEVLKASPEL